jgi:predicted PurR-regulated permease PerM
MRLPESEGYSMDRTLFITLLAYTFTLFLLYLLFTILSPFLVTLGWAAAVGVFTYPLYEKLLKYCNGREIAASSLMMVTVVLAVIVPLVGLIITLSKEAALAYQYLESAAARSHILVLGDILRHPSVTPWLDRFGTLTNSLDLELDTMLLPATKKALSSMLNYSTDILKNSLGFLIKLILMLITLFFIYKDGDRFMQHFWSVISVRENIRATVKETIKRVLGAVLYGVILTCLVQGALGGLGFWAAGLPSPFLFGTLMAICAPIPLVGTALIWLPGAIYLLTQGQIVHGVLLIIWGVLVVSSIDNIIRPLFISGKAKLPILVIALGILGGFLAFGLLGVIAGPVILALFLVFFEMNRKDTTLPADKVSE